MLLIHGSRRYGVEFKYSDAPGMTKSLHIALGDLKLDRAWIVYPGSERYAVDDKVEVVPLEAIFGRMNFMNAPGGAGRLRRRGTREA